MLQTFKLGKLTWKCFPNEHWEYVDRSSVIPTTPINQPKWDLENVKAKVDIYCA
jgi:hypothetical protein